MSDKEMTKSIKGEVMKCLHICDTCIYTTTTYRSKSQMADTSAKSSHATLCVPACSQLCHQATPL